MSVWLPLSSPNSQAVVKMPDKLSTEQIQCRMADLNAEKICPLIGSVMTSMAHPFYTTTVSNTDNKRLIFSNK